MVRGVASSPICNSQSAVTESCNRGLRLDRIATPLRLRLLPLELTMSSGPTGIRERRDLSWIRQLNDELRATPCPATLEEALTYMEEADVPLDSESGTGNYDTLRQSMETLRVAWRVGGDWGEYKGGLPAGYVAEDAAGRRAPLLRSLGLVAPAFAATDAMAEEQALTIACYTLNDPGLFETLNCEMSSTGRLADGNLSSRLRACLPFIKLLQTALEALPPAFIFGPESPTVDPTIRGRVWRAVKHVFPGYPGYANQRGGPSPRQHDPESHFAKGTDVCWYQFSSCSRNLQGCLAFAGQTGPATLFEVDIVHAYDISKLSVFGELEAEVLLPPLTQFEVIARPSKSCVPDGWAPGQQYRADYARSLGPDRVQLRQQPDNKLMRQLMLAKDREHDEAMQALMVELQLARMGGGGGGGEERAREAERQASAAQARVVVLERENEAAVERAAALSQEAAQERTAKEAALREKEAAVGEKNSAVERAAGLARDAAREISEKEVAVAAKDEAERAKEDALGRAAALELRLSEVETVNEQRRQEVSMAQPVVVLTDGSAQRTWQLPVARGVATVGTELFISASRFDGPKPGYVFKSGERGTGYYRDRGESNASDAVPSERRVRKIRNRPGWARDSSAEDLVDQLGSVGLSAATEASRAQQRTVTETAYAGADAQLELFRRMAADAGDARAREETGQPFIAAASFQGAKPGYAFRSGNHGLGYYIDH